MKKVCIICMLIFGLMTSIVFAENKIDDSRWFWIFSNDTFTVYLDKQNMEYNPEIDTLKTWQLINYPAKNEYVIIRCEVNYTSNTIGVYNYVIYNSTTLEPKKTGNENENGTIIPDSIGELIRDKSLTLINRDEELAKYKEQQEAEAKEAEQEQKDKEKEQRNKEIANTAIGIIGGLF